MSPPLRPLMPLGWLLAQEIPELPGARCAGHPRWFDPPRVDEDPALAYARCRIAARLCGVCPALGPCEAWLQSLPKNKKPPGVIAGRIRIRTYTAQED